LQTEDPGLAGVLEPDGKMVVLNAKNGTEVIQASVLQGKIKADDLKSIQEPLLLRDTERFYLALNRPVDGQVQQGVQNNFSSGLRCSVVNGWFLAFHAKDGSRQVGDRTIAWKKGDLHWHTMKRVANQMIVLEQFSALPVVIFTSRYNQVMAGGFGNRWVTSTQSINKKTGKLVWDSGEQGSNSAPLYHTFNIDIKAGTINMVGYSGALQHYVDDGRKTSAVDSPKVNPGLNPGLKLPPGFVPRPGIPNLPRAVPGFPPNGRFPRPRIQPLPIQPVPAPPLPFPPKGQ
jgi:hypothetical protein